MYKRGKNNHIHPTAIIEDNVEIGDNNIIGPYATIGLPGEVREHEEKVTGTVVIGNNNVIREFSRIHSPVRTDLTSVGNSNYIASNSHIGHDARVGSFVTMVTGSVIGGWVIVADYVNLAMGTKIHPRLKLGENCMVGLNSSVVENIPPFVTVVGVPSRILKFNERGCVKRGLDEEMVREAQDKFKDLFKGIFNTNDNYILTKIKEFILQNENVLSRFVGDKFPE